MYGGGDQEGGGTVRAARDPSFLSLYDSWRQLAFVQARRVLRRLRERGRRWVGARGYGSDCCLPSSGLYCTLYIIQYTVHIVIVDKCSSIYILSTWKKKSNLVAGKTHPSKISCIITATNPFTASRFQGSMMNMADTFNDLYLWAGAGTLSWCCMNAAWSPWRLNMPVGLIFSLLFSPSTNYICLRTTHLKKRVNCLYGVFTLDANTHTRVYGIYWYASLSLWTYHCWDTYSTLIYRFCFRYSCITFCLFTFCFHFRILPLLSISTLSHFL